MKNILFLLIVLLMFSGCEKKERVSSYTKKGNKAFREKGLKRKNSLEKNDFRRIALVVGNNAYNQNDPNFSPLKNAVNDAVAMKESLERFGFEVTLLKNAQAIEFNYQVLQFGVKLRKGGTGLFFYSGHGVQHNGINYFIPVESYLQRVYKLEEKAVSMKTVIQEMEHSGNRFNMIIVDACRTDLPETFFPKKKGESKNNSSFTSMKPPKGMCILFATGKNNSALEKSEDALGVFTKHFVTNMVEENVPLWKVFQETSEAVSIETKNAQIPWIESSGIPEFYFNQVDLEQKIKEAQDAERKKLEEGLLAVRKEAEETKASILSEVENLKNQQKASEKKSLQAEREYEKKKEELEQLEEKRKALEASLEKAEIKLKKINSKVNSQKKKENSSLKVNVLTKKMKKKKEKPKKTVKKVIVDKKRVRYLYVEVRMKIEYIEFIIRKFYVHELARKNFSDSKKELLERLDEEKNFLRGCNLYFYVKDPFNLSTFAESLRELHVLLQNREQRFNDLKNSFGNSSKVYNNAFAEGPIRGTSLMRAGAKYYSFLFDTLPEILYYKKELDRRHKTKTFSKKEKELWRHFGGFIKDLNKSKTFFREIPFSYNPTEKLEKFLERIDRHKKRLLHIKIMKNSLLENPQDKRTEKRKEEASKKKVIASEKKNNLMKESNKIKETRIPTEEEQTRITREEKLDKIRKITISLNEYTYLYWGGYSSTRYFSWKGELEYLFHNREGRLDHLESITFNKTRISKGIGLDLKILKSLKSVSIIDAEYIEDGFFQYLSMAKSLKTLTLNALETLYYRDLFYASKSFDSLEVLNLFNLNSPDCNVKGVLSNFSAQRSKPISVKLENTLFRGGEMFNLNHLRYIKNISIINPSEYRQGILEEEWKFLSQQPRLQKITKITLRKDRQYRIRKYLPNKQIELVD